MEYHLDREIMEVGNVTRSKLKYISPSRISFEYSHQNHSLSSPFCHNLFH